MSLSQWTRFSDTGTAPTESLSVSSVIEGGSSIRFAFSNGNRGSRAAFLTTGANVSTGKIRTAFQLIAFDTTGAPTSAPRRFGVGGMLQTSYAYTSTFYAFQIVHQAAGGSTWNTVGRIVKTKTDTTLNTGILTDFSGDLSLGATVGVGTHEMELKWQLDAGNGQMLLTAAFGSQLDFSDLTAIGSYTDGSPLSGGLSAGIYSCGDNNTSSPALDMNWDKTQIFKV